MIPSWNYFSWYKNSLQVLLVSPVLDVKVKVLRISERRRTLNFCCDVLFLLSGPQQNRLKLCGAFFWSLCCAFALKHVGVTFCVLIFYYKHLTCFFFVSVSPHAVKIKIEDCPIFAFVDRTPVMQQHTTNMLRLLMKQPLLLLYLFYYYTFLFPVISLVKPQIKYI